MKKFTALLVVCMFFATIGCGKKMDTLKPGEPIKIGFLGPMTGDAGNYGKLMSQAVKIAVAEKNAAGGIDGHKIELIIEDTEGKIEKANPAIEKLAGVDKIFGLVGSVFSSCSLAVAPKAQASKTIMISPSSTHKDLPSKGAFIFRTVMSDALQAVVFAKYVAKVEKVKTMAILYVKNDYSQGLAQDFKMVFEKEGGKVVAMESGLQGDKDFKTQLTKIKAAKPEALYIPNYVAEIAQILEQAKQLGLSVKIYSADGFSNPEIFELAGDLANNIIFANAAKEKKANKLSINFEKKYKSKWGQKPDAFSMNSYDGANIIIDAIEKVYNEAKKSGAKEVSIDRNKIQKYIAMTKNRAGVSGDVSFDAKGDLIKNMGIYKSEGQKYKQISVYTLKGDKLVEVK